MYVSRIPQGSLLNSVPCELKTYSRANMTYVLTYSPVIVPCVFTFSLANVSCVLTCSFVFASCMPSALVPTCLPCSRAHVRTYLDCLCALRVNMTCVLMYSRFNVPWSSPAHIPTCLESIASYGLSDHVITSQHALVVLVSSFSR